MRWFSAKIRPVWVGDLKLGQKIQKVKNFCLKIAILYFLALSASMQKIFKRFRLVRFKILSAVIYYAIKNFSAVGQDA
jgi:hypothetical protein